MDERWRELLFLGGRGGGGEELGKIGSEWPKYGGTEADEANSRGLEVRLEWFVGPKEMEVSG